jgi:hypothetical protein
MLHDESTLSDIAQWVKSLLPPELWERYCYLTYAQMARAPELADYARELREADRHWHRASKTRHIRII